VRNLEPVNGGGAAARQTTFADHRERAVLRDHADVFRGDARQRHDDAQHLGRLEHVDRRLPRRRARGPEELALQPLDLIEHFAGLSPHGCARISVTHGCSVIPRERRGNSAPQGLRRRTPRFVH
jgi:hypothetical protein